MKKKSTSSSPASTSAASPASSSKIDPTFLPKARVLIKKIKAKLSELEAGAVKSAPKKKKLAERVRKPKAVPKVRRK